VGWFLASHRTIPIPPFGLDLNLVQDILFLRVFNLTARSAPLPTWIPGNAAPARVQEGSARTFQTRFVLLLELFVLQKVE